MLPYMPPNLVNFGPERLRTVGEVFAHPRIGRRHCQPYRINVT